MIPYALLRHPGHNQVYFQNSAQLAVEEMKGMGLPLEQVELEEIGGLSYVVFSCEQALTEEQLLVLSRVSSAFALFQVEGEKLCPVLLPNPQVLDRSLGTILKYQGKTNEIFTRMLLNLALAQGGFSPDQVKLLDPVAGRGTTLFEALALGADVYGVEVQEKAVLEGQAHLKKFLEHGKIKHKTGGIRVSGANKSFTAKRFTVDLETGKKQHFELVYGDSKDCAQLFTQNFFHVIVGDLPYGVQHGNQAGGKHRSPATLLSSCLRGWHKVLKDNGVLALSWNLLVFSREDMERHLLKNGFQVLKLDDLSHQVDGSIRRDIVLCKKG